MQVYTNPSIFAASAFAVIAVSPNELMEDCITTLEREKMHPCTPAGRPMRRISPSASLYSRRRRRRTLQCPLVRIRRTSTRAAEIACAIMVPSATPATSIWQTTTKKIFSPTLATPAAHRIKRGVFESPRARQREEPKLYSKLKGSPAKYICKYSVERGKTLSCGTFINRSRFRAMSTPKTPKTTPPNTLSKIAVCTTRSSRCSFLAPIHRAAAVHEPTESPKNRLMIRFMSELVEPTAPAEISLAKRPKTMISEALYNSCNIPVAIIGREKRKILPKRGREHISGSRFCLLFARIKQTLLKNFLYCARRLCRAFF